MWRGVACLLVVIFHTTLVHGDLTGSGAGVVASTSAGEFLIALTRYMWIGVPMFFVISGYCISATADSARRRELPVKDYFVRRFRRIFPPYWAAILLQIGLLAVVDVMVFPDLLTTSVRPIVRPWDVSVQQWIGNLTLTESWRFHLGGDAQAYILRQAWTLCYEEQFYALTGLILFAAPRHYFRAALVVTIGTLLLRHGLRRFDYDTSGFFFDGRWLMFASGILIYYARNYAGRRATWASAVALGLLLAYAFREEFRELIFGTVFAMLLFQLHRWDDFLANLRILRPAAFLGTICYSLYLTHAPVVRTISQLAWNHGLRSDWEVLLLVVPVSAAAAIALGWGFYQVVERRFLNTARV